MVAPRLARVALLLCLLGAAAVGRAEEAAPTDDGGWYYHIGGGAPYFPLAALGQRQLAGSSPWNSIGSCGFPFQNSLHQYMGDMDNNIYGLKKRVIDSTSKLILASPMGVVQRANPGLYDLLMKGIADARRLYDKAQRECRSMQHQGAGVLGDWLALSKGHSWSRSRGRGEAAMVAEREIEEQGGAAGLPWVAGKYAGGTRQPALRPVHDVVQAGFRQWGRGRASALGDIQRVWRTPEQAAEWVVAVVGDKELRTCPRCRRVRTHLGAGLRPLQTQEFELLLELLEKSLAKGWRRIDLQRLSAAGMGIVVTAQLLQALGKESPAQQAILVRRLAGEIALARVLEKALIARQLLAVGRQEPNVAMNHGAQREIDQAQQRLQREMEEVLFEQRVRGAVFTPTAGLILERAKTRAAQGRGHLGAPTDAGLLQLEAGGAPSSR